MKIMIINGPSLNMLGIREPGIYGSGSYEDLIRYIKDEAVSLSEKCGRPVDLDFRQSNHEGDLIDWIQQAYFEHYDGIVINPGAYTHTSIALADAAAAVAPLPIAEVHLSDISVREDFRRISYLEPHCVAQIKGLGFAGYIKALETIISRLP